MGIFDKIKDALDGDDVEDAQKRADDAAKRADEAKKDLDRAKAEDKVEADKHKAEADKDKSIGDALKDKLDEAKKETNESADKAKQGKPKADKPKAPAGGGAKTYTVKPGDTLSAIGAKYGVSYMDIAKASGIDNPDLIFPGQVLTIPGK